VEDGEVSPDTASLAAAVFDHNGLPAAAVGLTVAHRCPAPPDAAGCGYVLAEYATVVRSAADALTSAIAGAPPSATRRAPRPSAL
jgi:DNA-binding IclR family transcriptional regulator